ncbi:MAG TPA: cbb3-type cytochrome c oxidase subunit I [Ilumatobacter sp.]|jgi:heme/copper-type cytochrome/quinol oxidase subunit 1|nr:cbb3-type cytochrome c oxidase subunit I [Ilumatobacter sp.]
MTTIETHAEAAKGSALESFVSGVAAWSVTTDHKRIGRIYVGFGLLGLLAVSVLGVLLGIERASESELFDSGSLLQIFQAQRVGLAFAGVIPLTLGLSIAVVPLQLGARQIAYPRLALTGCYMWLGGLALTFAALGRNGGVGGGDATAVDLFLAAHGLMVVGLAASACSVATSVLTTRAPGMTMRRVPLFSWSALIGALAMLIALPVLLGAVIYAFVDHRIGIQANFGTDGIGAWIAWAYSVPAVIVYAIPAVGVAAELMPVTFRHRQPMRGSIFAGTALVGVAAFAVVSMQRVHEVSLDKDQQFGDFVDDVLPFLIFAGLPVLGLLMVMALGGLTAKSGLADGRPRVTAGFLFADLGVAMILLGAVANAAQAITNLELLGTTFEEGATLLVVYGAAMAVFGGVLFWAPKLWGRVVPELHSLPLVLLALGGTVLAAGPLIIAGFLDQAGGLPVNDADVAAMLSLDYDSSGELWNWLSLIGHALMALAALAFAGLMVKVFTGSGDTAEANPYGGHTIEWSTTSPAPPDNYEFVPTVASPSPVFDMTYEGTRP